MLRIFLSIVMFALLSANAIAKECPRYVDRAIVLAIDSSGSIKAPIWDLQIAGYAATFRSRQIANNLIGTSAIAMVAWAGHHQQKVLIPWFCIDDAASSRALAAVITALRRPFSGYTYIGEALDYSIDMLTSVPFKAETKIIDISSDGLDSHPTPAEETPPSLIYARRKARANGITVNGLPIVYPPSILPQYYKDHIIVGKHPFIESVTYDDKNKPPARLDAFIHAMRKKLGRELNIAAN